MARTSPPIAGYPVFDYPNPLPLLPLTDKGDQVHLRTQGQLDSPSAADVANIEATFILSVAPFTRYISNGSTLIPAAASGAGSGTVTSVAVASANGVSGSVANSSTTPSIALTLGAITPSSVAASSTVTGSNLSGTNTGDQTIALTGDVTGSGTGTFAATLANTTVAAGSYTHSAITVDAKGRITAASSGTVPSGTVTSVNVTAPAAGITASGGPVTSSGSVTLALANDLAAVEGLATTGLVRRTATDTWSAGTAVALTSEVSGILPVANGGTGTATPGIVAGTSITVTGTWPNQTINATSGGGGSVTSVAAAAPTAGFTITGGPITGSGTLTFALADDLAAVEGLATTGIVRRTASNTWTAGTAVGLTTEVTGTLPVANGGTGLTTDVRNVTQNSQSAAYTFVLTDAYKHIYHPSADTTARTFTIPANASVAFDIGTTITIDNDFGAGALTIAITTDTLSLVGTAGSTGSRTLASGGQATLIKVTSTRWRISGVGLT